MEKIRAELARLKEIEKDLSQCDWNQLEQRAPSTSPRGTVEGSSPQKNISLIQRYEQARDLYLQRRLDNLLVEHISTFRPDDAENPFDIPQVDAEEDEELQKRYQHALATLETTVTSIQSQKKDLKSKFEVVKSRREELEKMLDDMEEFDGDTDAEMDEDVDESDVEAEQQRMEQLQQRKIQLQEKLSKVQAQTEEAQQKLQYKEEKVRTLQQQIDDPDQDTEELKSKVQELREMKAFYDSLCEVMEELGGVKIVKVEENSEQRHLFLTLAFYDDYQVQVELEVYRKFFLKLVNAKWLSEPVVRLTDTDQKDGEVKKDNFFLSMDPLDDLLRLAKTTLGPPHDLRFLVRETLARIRMTQERVEELAVLRLHVLTKVHNGNQIVCSLNEGIVIVMRFYEKFLQLEQVVGVGGWDETITSQLHATVISRLESELKEDHMQVLLFGSKIKPIIVVQFVQEELKKLQETPGWTNPKTPRFPERRGLTVNTNMDTGF